MQFISNKYIPYGILALLSIPLFFLNIHDVHAWGDDFAQYVKEAENIAHGKPFYQSGYIFNPYNTDYAPPQYPAGFPLLLAPIVKLWGIAIRPMLYFMTFICVCLLFALFEYFRKYTNTTIAVCLSVAVIYTNYMVDLKANILSDIPCLLFIVLYLTVRNAKHFPWWRIVLLVILATMAILIRSQAILLYISEIIYLLLLIIKSNIKNRQISIRQIYTSPSLYVIVGSLIINFILNKTIFYSPLSDKSFYYHFVQQILHANVRDILDANLHRLIQCIASFLFFETNDHGILNAEIVIVHSVAISFSLIGFFICIRKRIVIDDVFFILMCLLLVFMPVYDLRYFLPAIPLLFFYNFTMFRIILPAIVGKNYKAVGILLTLIYLRMGYGHLERDATDIPIDYVPRQKDKSAFQYITQHVNNKDIIVFQKPRLLTLYTDRKCVNTAGQISPEMNKKVFDSLQVKYFLIADELEDNFSKQYLQNIQRPIDSEKIADGYTLYLLR